MANPRTIARLESRIHERAAYCLQFEIRDPRAGFITVTGVELTEDLTSGKIRWSVLGDAAERNKAAAMLDHAAGFIQRQIARVLDLRRVPHLRWVYDERLENAVEIQALIREARERDRAINPALALEDANAPPPTAEQIALEASGGSLDDEEIEYEFEEEDDDADDAAGDDDVVAEDEPRGS